MAPELRAASLIRLFRRVALAANDSFSLADAAAVCLEATCTTMGWDAGHVYVESADAGPARLVSARVWYLSDDSRFKPFRDLSEALTFAQGEGLPGQVWQTGQPVWKRDLPAAREMPRRELARAVGLRAAVAFPIRVGPATVGVIEFFSTRVLDTDSELLDVMADVGVLLGRVVERARATRAIEQSKQEFVDFVEHAADAIFVYNLDGRITHVNRAACDLLRYDRAELLRMNAADFVDGVSRDELAAGWAALTPGAPQTAERIFRRKDGTTLVAIGRIRAFDTSGTRMLIATCRDVSADKAREQVLIHEIEQRRQAEELAKIQTETLARTLETLANEQRLDAVLSTVLTAIAEQLEAQGAGLWIASPDGRLIVPAFYCEDGHVVPAAESSHPAMQCAADIEDEHPMVRELRATRRPLVHQISTDEVIRPDIRDYLRSKGITTVLTIPLFMKERLVGFLTARRGGPAHFSEEHVRIGQALAHQASLAIELTRLADEARKSAVAAERARLAGDIHDALAQSFTAVIVQVQAALRAVEGRGVDEHLALAIDAARAGLAEARRSVAAMRALDDDPVDLVGRIRAEVARLGTLTGQVAVVRVTGDAHPVPGAVADPLLRVVQEGMNNVARHAAGAAVRIAIRFDGDAATVSVEDDGPGFASSASAPGYGLLIMRERIERAGGWFALDTSPGRGTRLEARIRVNAPRGGPS